MANLQDEVAIELVWERHSQLVETIRCDQRQDESIMTRKDFERAACALLSGVTAHVDIDVQPPLSMPVSQELYGVGKKVKWRT